MKTRMAQMELPGTAAPDARECADCTQPAVPGMSRCAVHRLRHAERERNRRADRRKTGKCWYCGKRARRGKSDCAAHSSAARRKGVAKSNTENAVR